MVVNNTSFNSFSVSGPSIYYNNVTLISSLNVSGITNLNNTNISGTTGLNNNTTLISSLNVSGITTLNNNTSINGSLSVSNITLRSNGKINSYDDYHYIQLSQPTDTLTIQEYGTISFNIGQTKTQKSFINSNGLTVSDKLNISGTTTLNNITTLVSSLNVSVLTTLNNATTMLSSLNIFGNIIGPGTALTNLNYNAITNKPNLTV
jgi:hypothetical protein